MHDELGFGGGDRTGQRRLVVHIADDRNGTHPFEQQRSLRYASEHNDLVAVSDQQRHKDTTNSTRAARGEDIHSPSKSRNQVPQRTQQPGAYTAPRNARRNVCDRASFGRARAATSARYRRTVRRIWRHAGRISSARPACAVLVW